MRFEIEDNIPIPKARVSKNEVLNTAAKLNIGQSFGIPKPEPKSASYLRTQLGLVGRTNHKKFITRTVVEAGIEMLRIWRTE